VSFTLFAWLALYPCTKGVTKPESLDRIQKLIVVAARTCRTGAAATLTAPMSAAAPRIARIFMIDTP
jgi:hypothetical protein